MPDSQCFNSSCSREPPLLGGGGAHFIPVILYPKHMGLGVTLRSELEHFGTSLSDLGSFLLFFVRFPPRPKGTSQTSPVPVPCALVFSPPSPGSLYLGPASSHRFLLSWVWPVVPPTALGCPRGLCRVLFGLVFLIPGGQHCFAAFGHIICCGF